MARQYNNYADIIDFTRASSGTALTKVSYGEELVTNGTFDTDVSGWYGVSAGVVSHDSVNNALKVTANAGDNFAAGETTISTVVGAVYKLTVDIISFSGVSVQIGVATTSNGIDISVSNETGSEYSLIFVAQSSTTYVKLGTNDTSGLTHNAVLDNISLREVTFGAGALTLFNHPVNVPRVEYDADGNRLGLLVEEARTNLIASSNQLGSAQRGTVTSGFSDPAGGLDALEFVCSGGSDPINSITITGSFASKTVTFSVWLKLGENPQGYSPNVKLYIYGSGLEGLASEDVTISSNWQRFHLTTTFSSGFSSSNLTLRFDPFDGVAIAPVEGTSIYFYGRQLEEGSFPTSYIPTSGSTATRSADVASIGVSEFGYNSSEGTVFVDWAVAHRPWTGFNRVFEIGKSGGPNQISLLGTSGTNNTYPSIVDNSVSQLDYNNTFFTVTTSNFYKVCMSFKQNDFNLAYNSNLVVGDTLLTVPQIDQTNSIFIGSDRNGSSRFTGYIKSIKYYPRALTASQLEALTL